MADAEWLAIGGLAGTSLAMVGGWLRQRHTRNAGIVDVLWIASLGALALAYAASGDGWAPRRALIAVLAGVWSARLTLHLAHRVRSEREDGRYAQLRRKLGNRFDRWMFVFFFQAPAVLASALSLVFLVLSFDEHAAWRSWDALAVVLWVVALTGECLADRQLSAWRAEGLQLVHFDDIGPHYARTLALWRQNLLARWSDARRLGFSEEFLRSWEFYFCHCEGGFAEHHIGNAQMLFARRGAGRSAPA